MQMTLWRHIEDTHCAGGKCSQSIRTKGNVYLFRRESAITLPHCKYMARGKGWAGGKGQYRWKWKGEGRLFGAFHKGKLVHTHTQTHTTDTRIGEVWSREIGGGETLGPLQQQPSEGRERREERELMARGLRGREEHREKVPKEVGIAASSEYGGKRK